MLLTTIYEAFVNAFFLFSESRRNGPFPLAPGHMPTSTTPTTESSIPAKRRAVRRSP